MIATMLQLLELARAPRARLAFAVLVGALTIVFGVGLMTTAGYLISRAVERPAILSLTVAIVGVRFFGLARPVARYFERLTSHDLAFRVLGRVRLKVYERIEQLAPGQLGGYRGGDVLSRMVSDVDALQNLHLRGLGPPLVGLAAGAVSIGAAATVLPAAGVVLALGLVTGGVLVPIVASALPRRSGRHLAHARGELAAELVETVSGAPELVVYGGEDDRLRRLRAVDDTLTRIARKAAFADGVGDAMRLLVTGATVAATLAVAVSAHTDGRLDRVMIALLALLALASFEAVQPLGQAARELIETVAAGRRVLDLTDCVPAVVDPLNPRPVPTSAFAVALEGVRVRYADEETPALENFSLRLEPGRRVALVGPSGAGKTTVTDLLLRFLDPEQGRVTLADADLREYRMEDVRACIAVAGQDAHLFSATIRDNIKLGREATKADLQRVLRDARLEEWVSTLPDGLDTLVGEAGSQVSGGQRQRIVLARALLGREPILVLDEPTAHLDPPTAERLIDDVFAAAGERSVLLITHRSEGLEHVDDVVQVPGALRS